MRTTIKVSDDILRRAKKAALERDETLNDIVEHALGEFLRHLEQPAAIRPVKLPKSKKSGGVQPGVDLDDSAALMDLLDGEA